MRFLLALPLAAIAVSAAAYDPIVIARGWQRVADFENETCTGEAGSNGRFYVMSAAGFAPGEPLFLTITNGDMKPIERAVRADAGGRWQEYYIPFRFGRDGGEVSMTLAGDTCVVPLDFGWTRAKGWDEPAPLRPR